MSAVEVADMFASRAVAARGQRALILAVSGIDASGKTTIASQIAARLAAVEVHTVVVALDDWHTPASVRFSTTDPAGHFYRHAYRYDELFATIVEPIRRDRRIDAELHLRRLRNDAEFRTRFRAEAVDVLMLEGIFLLRRELRDRYDGRVWVDCSFERALERAVARNQEGLPPDRIVDDYRRIYFPAERLHFTLDNPRAHADAIVPNDC